MPPTKPRSESPTFFFQEGEMKVASHFSGKARGKSSRSLAFHTHFTPKGIPGANGSWTNMSLAPFSHTFGDGAFHCQFDSLALGCSTSWNLLRSFVFHMCIRRGASNLWTKTISVDFTKGFLRLSNHPVVGLLGFTAFGSDTKDTHETQQRDY